MCTADPVEEVANVVYLEGAFMVKCKADKGRFYRCWKDVVNFFGADKEVRSISEGGVGHYLCMMTLFVCNICYESSTSLSFSLYVSHSNL